MILTSIALILICVGIIYLTSNYRKRLRFIQAANALPGPKTKPIIGNAYYILQRNFNELLDSVCLLVDTYPSPFRFWLGSKLLISVNEPDQIKTILQNPCCLNKSLIYKVYKAVLGNGLVTAPEHIWVRHRKMLAPSFNTNILRTFCDIFVNRSLVFTEELEHMVNGEVDLSQHILKCTLDSISGTSLGTELQLKKIEQYLNAIVRVKQIITYRLRNIFLLSDFIFNLTSLSREQQKNLNFIYSVTEEVIQQNAMDNLVGNKIQSAKPSRRRLVDILMETSDEGKKFTRNEIIDEINTIVGAGTDTTAIALNFIIFMLANFPEIQQKVYEELLEIYDTQDPKSVPVDFKDLQHMNYLECIIKETLRLFPPVPLIGRQLNEDLQIGGYTLPKGADILITILTLHRNEKYWPKALTFDPDRFLPENMTNIHPYSYITFSNGPRNCIGAKYAMISMKILIATLLRTYILKVDKEVKIEQIKLMANFLLAPVIPLKVRIEKRK
ncbi:cytochrome P450 4C1-like isoform X2 [Odontomachus brunneus]|nr:cytochrome P450 4C1-like isoform X2 [Odontomachus brunneus]XP_032663023.1 cytochrome P450 4C1-like isoform X2 [Odontomachus brunneus]